MKRIKIVVLAILLSSAMACTGMTQQEQRALSGGAIGAAGGAIIGAIAGSPGVGAAIGGSVGVATGALWDDIKNRTKGK